MDFLRAESASTGSMIPPFLQRFFTDRPFVVPLWDLVDVKLSKWHSGRRIYGAPIVKIIW